MLTNYKTYLSCILLFFSSVAGAFQEVDFDQSMGIWHKERYNEYTRKTPEISEKHLNLFRIIFNNNKISQKKHTLLNDQQIPKIIHQIWLGPIKKPKIYDDYLKSWIKLHPDWQYKLWTEREIEGWDFKNRDLFEDAKSYQEKADILRYEILYKFGGLYIDTDYEALKNFDKMNEYYQFYAGIEPGTSHHGRLVITNALIGSVPNHPIIKKTLELARSMWVEEEQKILKKYGRIKSPVGLAIQRSMYPLTLAAYEFAKDFPENVIIMPPTYFMPIVPGIVKKRDLFSRLKRLYYRTKKRIIYGDIPDPIIYDISFNKTEKETMAVQDFEDETIVTPVK